MDRDAPATAGEEARRLAKLALPLVAVHAGSQVAAFVDMVFVGRLPATQIAAYGIGSGALFAVVAFGMGCVFGIEALASQAVGAGERVLARRSLWQGVRIALVLSVPIMAAILLIPRLVALAGVESATVAEIGRYLLGRLPGIPAFLVATACRAYLQAEGATRPIVFSMLVFNAVNLALDAMLIHGDRTLLALGLAPIGLPALGVLGCGLASAVSATVGLTVLALGIRGLECPPDADRRKLHPELMRSALRLGIPFGGQGAADAGGFAMLATMAGRIGAEAAAAYSVAISWGALTYTISYGIGSATSVRVGWFVGRGDTPSARRAGLVGLACGAVFMACAGIVFFTAGGPLARLLTDKAAVAAAAVPLLAIAALFQISDGTNAIATGALRGAGDTRSPFLAMLIGVYGVAVPAAWYFAFRTGLGGEGLWWGATIGLSAAAIILFTRFWLLSRRHIERV